MELKLPPNQELRIEVDGEVFHGSWYIILDRMVVNYSRYTTSTHEFQTNAAAVVERMLRELVEKHYTRLGSIPSAIPQTIRLAAHRYVNRLINSVDEDEATADLVASFGESVTGSAAHRQLSWLCVNSISMIVPAWKFMCDGNAPEETFNTLRNWLQNPEQVVDWSAAMTPVIPLRKGARIDDCHACRLEPTADAVASTARYLRSADIADAIAALCAACYAYDEGCHSSDAPERFEKWLVFDVLSTALACQPLGESV